MGKHVGPACIYTEKVIPTNVSLVITGWGKTENFDSTGSSQLRKATVDLFPQESCARTYTTDIKGLDKGIVEEMQVCAGSYNDVNSTCQVDNRLFFHKIMKFEGLG